MSALGAQIAYWRRQRGMTQQQFARVIGRSKSWVDKVERGARPLDRVSVLIAVAEALRIEPGLLIDTAIEGRP